MARKAVALDVTRRAPLKSLPRGAAVLQQPERLGIVKRDIEPAATSQPALRMTAAAEQLRVVTRGALRLTTVRVRGMTLREVGGVEEAPVLAGMAVGTEALFVASLAGEPTRRGLRAVRRAEATRVHLDHVRSGGTIGVALRDKPVGRWSHRA